MGGDIIGDSDNAAVTGIWGHPVNQTPAQIGSVLTILAPGNQLGWVQPSSGGGSGGSLPAGGAKWTILTKNSATDGDASFLAPLARLTNNTVGGDTAFNETIAGTDNVFLGYKSGQAINATSSSCNVMVGSGAGRAGTASFHSNVGIGWNTFQQSTNAWGCVAIGREVMAGTQSPNASVAIGYQAMNSNMGSQSVSIGHQANQYGGGPNNVCLGYWAGRSWATGQLPAVNGYNNCIVIGSDARPGGAAVSTTINVANDITIGANARGQGANTITFGSTAITAFYCQVTSITGLSDPRLKTRIEKADTNRCLKAVKGLPVHRWEWIDRAGAHPDKHVTGFLSSSVKGTFPKSVTKGRHEHEGIVLNDAEYVTMTEGLPTLWGAVQALLDRVEELEAEVKELRGKHGEKRGRR